MKIAFALAFAALLTAGSAAAAEDEYVSYYCDDDKHDVATEQVFTVGGWQELHAFYTRFAGCDYGVVTDGVSYRVAELLAYQWGSFKVLYDLLYKNHAFKPYVLGHIDRAMTQVQADAALDNLRNRCPESKTKLCAEIEQAVLDRNQEK